MTAWQLEWGKISVASIGCASNHHINLRWYGKLLAAPSLVVCMDADGAGEKAAAEIVPLSRAVKIDPVPIGKDLNEFSRLAGEQKVQEWICAEIM